MIRTYRIKSEYKDLFKSELINKSKTLEEWSDLGIKKKILEINPIFSVEYGHKTSENATWLNRHNSIGPVSEFYFTIKSNIVKSDHNNISEHIERIVSEFNKHLSEKYCDISLFIKD